ncbi:MAG: TonB-dependent receptor [Saprospiraceae bacterium]|nr:TonB-dependent receptor [Saprospiraceae bacterium]
MKQLFILFCLAMPFGVMGQQSQTVSGRVTDKITQQTIVGATVIINSEAGLATFTDENGSFEIREVPVGRQTISVNYLGYQNYQSEGFVLNSAKAVYLEIELLESTIDLSEVVVSAGSNVNTPINELSVVSTRSFSADETDRIAASVNDPGRLALAYPGVAQGSDDNENDIIIRGNSSFGMMWRLEGIDIPNPNHFARPGTSGGGITVFSAQLLSRSDFSTGGMPAEYGNAISGVMDVHFRKGNMTDRQHRVKVGLLGIDLATEGPIKKGASSYLVNYRYSTLGILTNLGIYLVGERVTNEFQDLSFNVVLTANEKSRLSFFGLGGLSQEHYNPVAKISERDSTDASHWEDRIRDSNMGAVGTTYTRFINKKSYFKAAVALMGSQIEFYYDVLDQMDNRSNYHDERHNESRLVSSFTYNWKVTENFRVKTGLLYNYILNYDFYKKTIQRQDISNVLVENANLAINGSGSTSTIQYYVQGSQNLGSRTSLNVGGHFLYLPLNDTYSVEPRVSLRVRLNTQQTVSFAYGLYSKILPMAAYFYQVQDTVGSQIQTSYPNLGLPLIKSQHLVLSYDYATATGLRFSAEMYYQRLFNVPISGDSTDLYWMLNERSSFPETDVESGGKGENYGLDLAVEKFFSSKVFFLLTGSFFQSWFYPKDGNRYPTTFANDFVSALTLGREFSFKKDRTLQAGFRVLFNGGNRYTPLDEAASLISGTYVGDESQTNSARIPNYFRIDARIAYRFNRPNLAGNLSLDIQNVLNYKNPSGIGYSSDTHTLFFRNHTSGLVPVLAMQVDF